MNADLSKLTAQEREDLEFYRELAKSPVPQIGEFHQRNADRILEVARLREDFERLKVAHDSYESAATKALAERDVLKAERDRLRKALHPGPKPSAYFHRGGNGVWWYTRHAGETPDEYLLACCWCDFANRYEAAAGLRVDEVKHETE